MQLLATGGAQFSFAAIWNKPHIFVKINIFHHSSFVKYVLHRSPKCNPTPEIDKATNFAFLNPWGHFSIKCFGKPIFSTKVSVIIEILNCSFNKLLTIFGRKIVSNLSKEIIIGLSHGIFFNLQINPKLESKGFFTTVTTGPSTPKKFSYFGRTNSKKFWRNPQMSGKTGQCRNFFKRGD